MCYQQSLRSACAYTASDQSLCLSLEYSMIVKLLTEHHLEFLSLKGGCRGSSKSTLCKISNCRKSYAAAQFFYNSRCISSSSLRGCLLKGSVWEFNKCLTMMCLSMIAPLGSSTGSLINVSINGSDNIEIETWPYLYSAIIYNMSHYNMDLDIYNKVMWLPIFFLP